MNVPRADRLLAGLFALELLATLVELRFGPGLRVSTEERYNAIAGAQLACGHVEALWALQYRPFCGGCTTEALLAAPLLRLLGAGTFVWKLVPAGFHLLLVGAGALLARELAGALAGAAFLAFALSAPEFFRELSFTGFGNHIEASALTLSAAALCARACRAGAPGAGPAALAQLFTAGLLAGASIWFCRSTAYALPGLLLVGLWATRARGLIGIAGALVGLLPFALQHHAIPLHLAADPLSLHAATLAPPDALYRWLVGDFLEGGLWPDGPQGELDLLGGALWGGLLLLGLGGATLHAGGRPAPVHAARALPLLLCGGLLTAWLIRFDLWDDNPAVRGYDPFNLRYRAPLLPLLWLGAALAAASVPRRGPRGLSLALLGGWLIVGGARRVGGWTEVDHPPAFVAGDRADATVPVGAPPQRLDRAQGRPQDLVAAAAFLDQHVDRLAICRQDHLFELGRRVGLGGAGEAERCAALPADPHPDDAQALRSGLARGLAVIAAPGAAPAVAAALCACRPYLCSEPSP